MLRVRTVLSGWPGAPGLQTFYFQGSGDELQSDADDAVARVRAFWVAFAGRLAIPETAQVQGDVDVVDPSTGNMTNVWTATTPPAAVTGAGDTTFNSFPSMALLRMRTGGNRNGKPVKGRSFIGPLTAASDINGAPGPGTQTDLVTAATAMLTGTTDIVPVVWSRNTGGLIPDGEAFAVTGYSASPKWAILRSRRD